MKVLKAGLALSLFTTLWAINQYDPGSCGKNKRGKFVVVKDRSDDDRIVACVQQHGKYRWELLKGHSYGNYFDPAKDCSAVVDNVPNAKSGVYWIQTKNGPIKAWCDVDTDNGGFILIGVKDTPETWAIPSNFTPVHPKGPAKWSTAFGHVKVLDFRVQISTSKDFRDTRAHWYYRFKSPRILSKLLMKNEGGCSDQYPGIGNISYVKDLMAREIVTKNFNCSLFGASIARGLGWDKMNKCFKQACSTGFAYLLNYHIDTSGSYSYSVKSASSGIQNSQTSFIGCDHGKCCACFGPDSTQDYCAPKCKAINGGTVLKKEDNITVWFWIRSSLPKRVWKQCMEFKEKNHAGKMETWRVEAGVKRKGPCSVPNDNTINDGIAVVANSGSMNKLPKVEGLLSYRSDDRKLYLKEKSEWEALANQKEVQNVIERLKRFKQEFNNELTKVNRKNSRSEKKIRDVTQSLNNVKQQVTKANKDVQALTHQSCKQIWTSQRNGGSGVYRISVGKNQDINAYCQMSSISGCSGGGWTLVMKIDGKSTVFRYDSSYWRNKGTYNDNSYGRNGGLDYRQFKGSTYWRTSFKEICVGMRYHGRFRAFSFSYPASSLYDLIADGQYRETRLGRYKWKSLIYRSSLQRHCNQEGFNAQVTKTKVRLGIIANEQNDCNSPDSFLGLGTRGDLEVWRWCDRGFRPSANAAGNLAQCTPVNGNKNAKVWSYILIR